MHFYHFNIADYRKDTGHLTLEEHYTYRLLLDEYYLAEAPISLDKRAVMRKLRLTLDQANILDQVLEDFFIETDRGYLHPRVESELAKIYEKSEKAKASINARWHRKGYERNTNVIRSKYEHDTKVILPKTQDPIPKTQVKKERAKQNKFVPPTHSQLVDYMKKAGLVFDANVFLDHFISNGWRVGGKSPMKDWKAAARNFAKREASFSGKGMKGANGKLQMPRQDEDLESFADKYDLPKANPGESYPQYRGRLRSAIELREARK